MAGSAASAATDDNKEAVI
uniref:Uncharacterized protein n=1 Tax=Oryza sativa subsp. japonica TaxID=39947 RepID=Q33BF2_ORYSJ|nr:hypothetical protein LOC_Os10g02369 [Oryza sativa Japonica Group]